MTPRWTPDALLGVSAGSVLALGWAVTLRWPETFLAALVTPWWLHLAVALIVCALLAVRRAPGWSLVLLLAAMAASAGAWTRWVGGPDGSPATLSLLSVNVERPNQDRDRMAAWILSQDVDVAVVLEVEEGWMATLAPLSARLPHHRAVLRDDNYGLAVWSRWPVEDVHALLPSGAEPPWIVVDVQHPGGTVRVAAVHLPPPRTPAMAAWRDVRMAEMAQAVARWSRPVVVAGDFNHPPWGPLWSAMLTSSGLKDAGDGAGVWATWPRPLGRFGIPIDQVLVSHDVEVSSYAAGVWGGGDHRGLVVGVRP